jgi:hypothetical protein
LRASIELTAMSIRAPESAGEFKSIEVKLGIVFVGINSVLSQNGDGE